MDFIKRKKSTSCDNDHDHDDIREEQKRKVIDEMCDYIQKKRKWKWKENDQG